MRSIWVVMSLLCVAAVAGCVTSDGDATEAPPAGGGAPASFDETTGAISGLVQTDELAPVPGAQVGTADGALATTANDAGAFAFSNLEPGTYALIAQALGYQVEAKRVDVAIGQASEVLFTLVPLPSDDPYHLTDVRVASLQALMYKLTPTCIYTDVNTLAKTCGGVRLACDPGANCEVHYEDVLDETWMTMLGEVEWEAQSGVTGKGFVFDISAPNVPRGEGGSINQQHPYTFFKMQPNPPIIWRIENPETLVERGIAEEDYCCDWFYRLFGGYCDLGSTVNNCELTPDYGIAIDNVANVYMTFFFKEKAPVDWTGLPDA